MVDDALHEDGELLLNGASTSPLVPDIAPARLCEPGRSVVPESTAAGEL
jgi:hypothetical protein